MQVHVQLHHEKTCLLCMRKERRKSAFCMYILFNVFLVIFTCKITSNQKIIISWVAGSWVSICFYNKIHTYRKYLKALRCVVICAFFSIINLITVYMYIVICTAFFAVNAKPKILAKIIANTNELQHIPVYFITIV